MIDSFARKITQRLIDKEIIPFDDWDIYLFGLQMMIGGIVKFAGFMLIAWVLNWIPEALVFICTFSLLRVSAGGYHADTYLKCFIITSIATFLSIWLVKSFSITYLPIALIALLVISALLVLRYAPVDTPNKRMIGDEAKIYRAKSLKTMILQIVAIMTIYLIYPQMITFCSIAAMAMFFEGITLTPIFADIK